MLARAREIVRFRTSSLILCLAYYYSAFVKFITQASPHPKYVCITLGRREFQVEVVVAKYFFVSSLSSTVLDMNSGKPGSLKCAICMYKLAVLKACVITLYRSSGVFAHGTYCLTIG